jgi:hypothetical protein
MGRSIAAPVAQRALAGVSCAGVSAESDPANAACLFVKSVTPAPEPDGE